MPKEELMTENTPPTMAPPAQKAFYQAYELEEETERSTFHYEKPPEFFYVLTGSECNSYSASTWEACFTMTQAQEKKMDRMAELMELKPDMRILDVGCG